jgi:hypothetical protein
MSRRGHRAVLSLALGGALVAALAALLTFLAPTEVVPLDPARLVAFGRCGWSVDVRTLRAGRDPIWTLGRMDSMAAPFAARHRVLVDGRALAPGHAQHAEIAELGEGRHSFWSGALLFSLPDREVAPAEVHSLEVELALKPRPWIMAIGVLGAGVALFCGLRCCRGRALARTLPPLGAGAAIALLSVVWFDPPRAAAVDAAPAILLWIGLGGALLAWAVVIADATGRRGALPATLRRGRRVLELTARRWCGWQGRCAVMALLLLSLLRVWAPLPHAAHHESDVSPSAFCRGRILASDSMEYWSGAQSLRCLGVLNEFSSRRPLSPALHGAQSALLGGDRQRVMVLNALLAGVALASMAIAVGRCAGPWVGLGTLAFGVGYAQQFVAYPLTETLGLTLGAIGLAQLLDGVMRQRPGSILLGSLSLAAGMMARAGALLALPVPALASILLVRPRRRGLLAALLSLVAIGAAWTLNRSVFEIAAAPGAAPNANVPYVTLGIMLGGDWSDAQRWLLEAHPDASGLSDEQRAQLLLAETKRRLWAEPSVLLRGVLRGLATFGRDWTMIAWGRFAERGTVQSLADQLGLSRWTPGQLGVPSFLVGALLAAASVAALLRLLQARSRVGVLMALLGAAVAASLPFIWIDGRWRALAPTWPIVAVIATLWLMPPRAWLAPRLSGRVGECPCPRPRLAGPALAALGVAVTAAPLVGAVALSLAAPRPALPPGSDAAVILVPRTDRLSAVIIGAEEEFSWLGPARMRRGTFEQELRTWGRDVEVVRAILDEPSASMAIVQTIRAAGEAGLPRELLLAIEPSAREDSRPFAAWSVRVLRASAYLGGLGRAEVVGPASEGGWRDEQNAPRPEAGRARLILCLPADRP